MSPVPICNVRQPSIAQMVLTWEANEMSSRLIEQVRGHEQISSTIVSGCPDIPSNILEELWCCETDPHVGPGLHISVWLICIFHCVAGDQITLHLKMLSSALFSTQRINNLKVSHGHTGSITVSVKDTELMQDCHCTFLLLSTHHNPQLLEKKPVRITC